MINILKYIYHLLMYIPSKYAKEFMSYYLSMTKYESLYKFALLMRDMRNKVSKFINENKQFVLSMSKNEFVTYMRHNFEDREQIPSTFDYKIYGNVYVCYMNRFEVIKRKIKFYHTEYGGAELYKKDVPKKNKKKGDVKYYIQNNFETELTSTLTYIARYGKEDETETLIMIINSVQKSLHEDNSENKVKFLETVISKIEKFGYDHLKRLAFNRRDRVFNFYPEQIQFKSLTLAGKSRKTAIIEKNKNEHSKIKAFIKLSGIPGYDSFDIPVRISGKYHGKVEDYLKKSNEYDYVLVFDERNKRVKVIIVKDGDRYFPELTEITKENTIGIDVNVKHNLFVLSDGTVFDYDRRIVAEYCQIQKLIDERKKRDKNYVPSKDISNRIKCLETRMKKSNQELIAKMCKDLQEKDIKHIAMEDLDNSFKRSFAISDEFGVKWNTVVKFLNLSSLKDEVLHIASHYDIAVTFVPSAYSSQRCPFCGCVHEENRCTQEEFCCIKCGKHYMADFIAANNIKQITVSTVLRDGLLKSNKEINNGSYEPKKINYKKIKGKYESCRKTLVARAELLTEDELTVNQLVHKIS